MPSSSERSARDTLRPPKLTQAIEDVIIGVSLGARKVSRNSLRGSTTPKVLSVNVSKFHVSKFHAQTSETCETLKLVKLVLLYLFRRSAACANPFASALFSRGTCEMENFNARASLRQVQCKE